VITKDTSGVWMIEGTGISCARRLAEISMQELGLDPGDHQTRDRVTMSMNMVLHAMLEASAKCEYPQ